MSKIEKYTGIKTLIGFLKTGISDFYKKPEKLNSNNPIQCISRS